MSQSNYIAAAIAVAFLVFITAKGSLSKYISLMTGGEGFGQDTAAAGTTTTAEQAVSATKGATDAKQGDVDTSSKTPSAGPLDLLNTVLSAGGPADDILGGVAGKLGVGAIIGGIL